MRFINSIISWFTRFFNTPSGMILTLVLAYYFLFSGRKKQQTATSTDPTVNDAIKQIDFAIDRLGTKEELVYSVFERLTKSEIIRLYKDFGYRTYNTIMGEYVHLSPTEEAIFVTPNSYNLQALLGYEMSSKKEQEKLKKLHKNKGLDFPFIS